MCENGTSCIILYSDNKGVTKILHQLPNLFETLHESDLLRCFRDSGSVTYVSTLQAPSPLAPGIPSFVQSLSTFEANVREWHFVQHSLYLSAVAGEAGSGALGRGGG